jgi:hypothetical protein
MKRGEMKRGRLTGDDGVDVVRAQRMDWFPRGLPRRR